MRRTSPAALASAAKAIRYCLTSRCCGVGTTATAIPGIPIRRGYSLHSKWSRSRVWAPAWTGSFPRAFSQREAMCEAEGKRSPTTDAPSGMPPGSTDANHAATRSNSAAGAAPGPTTTTTTPAGDHAPIFSSSVVDRPAAQQQLDALLAPAGRWSLSAHRKGLERAFQFKTFKKTWEFMDAVAAECRREKHHPEWANVYNRTHVRWTTHRPEGLSLKDLNMARFCDGKAEEFGEDVPAVPPTAMPTAIEQSSNGDTMQELSDIVAKDGCEVCAR